MDVSYSSSSSFTYSLNSPVLDPPPLPRSARRVSSFNPPSSFSPSSFSPPPSFSPQPQSTSTIRLVPPVPVAVLGSPDPALAVQAQRRSVQFSNPSGQVNWARPLNQPGPSSYRPSMRISPTQRPGSTSSNSDDDLPLTPLQAYLPPGAAPADRWPGDRPTDKPGEKPIGLGMSGISFDDSDSGVSSPPTTPTRLQFVSESLDALSFPSTLEELTRLRRAAAELDQESKKLRRHKGRDPATLPRLLPRKAVPVATEEELRVAPKPRRAAVRHSLFVASPPSFDDLEAPPLPALTPSPPAPARKFYTMGKAAMSSIEFTRSTDTEMNSLRMDRRFVSAGASTSKVPTIASLRGSVDAERPQDELAPLPSITRASPTAPGPPVLASPPLVPSPPSPDVERTHSVKHKASSSFLGKHKKLSRFLGKST